MAIEWDDVIDEWPLDPAGPPHAIDGSAEGHVETMGCSCKPTIKYVKSACVEGHPGHFYILPVVMHHAF